MGSRGGAAGVRILHRASDEPAATASDESAPDLAVQLQQLQDRLASAKASAASEKKRLADELKLERAGRERAEELLLRQAKELESQTAAKQRLEEAFSRSMSELRCERAERGQAEQTIQQLLRELMMLREIVGKQDALLASVQEARSGGGRGSLQSPGGREAGFGALGSGEASPPRKHISKGRLLGELQQLRCKLGVLQEEKERAQQNEELIASQTAKLLDDRAALVSNLGSKNDAVRNLEAALHLALADRDVLLEQLRAVAGPEGCEALASMSSGGGLGFGEGCSGGDDELDAALALAAAQAQEEVALLHALQAHGGGQPAQPAQQQQQQQQQAEAAAACAQRDASSEA